MGNGCSCFGQSSSSLERMPDRKAHNVGFLTTPDTQIMKWQRQLEEVDDDDDDKKEFKTLKDCILASPSVNACYTCNSGDEILQSHIHKQNKVYPSLVQDCPDYGYNNQRGSFSKQRLLMDGEIDSCRVPSLRKSRSKKSKKRVSFRLPEESDIIIYNLTEDDE